MTDWREWRIAHEELAQRQFLVVDADDSPFAFREAANGVNRNVMILVGYAAMRFKGELYRAKLTFKRFADVNVASKAYAYHVTRIEVLTGTIGNDLSGTAPNANTSTTNQGKENLTLMPSILLNGVVDVNGVPFLSEGGAR